MNAPYRARRPAELLSGTFFLDLGGGPRDTILVAGSGRSGTTWLSELINRENEHRFIFEPFPRKQYLRPEDDRSIHLEAAGKILSGKTRSRWADKFNRKLLARRRLVKDIRANLLLGWTRRHFPEMPTILILRHPCAVAESRLRLGWRDNLDEVMSQKQLVEDHLEPFEADILAAKDPFERSIFLWCIENHVPLRQPGSEELHIVFYEKLISDPEGELASISKFLEGKKHGGFAPSPGVDHRAHSGKPPPRRRGKPMGRLRAEGVPSEDRSRGTGLSSGSEPRSEPRNPATRRLATQRTSHEDDISDRLRTESLPPEGGSRVPGYSPILEPRSVQESPAGRLRTGEYSPGEESEMRGASPGSEAWRISGWTKRVDAERRKRAVEIMELFGMDRIYGEDPMPRPDGVLEP